VITQMSEQNKLMLEAVEQELEDIVNESCKDTYIGLRDIFNYQMGWEASTNGTTGKRIRPLLLLLTVDTLGQDWKKALPAAAALELLHNYSLIHDDIEDGSTLRRGKETVWVRWGQAQGINTGDAMLNLALTAPWRLEKHFPIEKVADVVQSMQNWSLELTKGQYLDISFENRENVTVEDYFEMVEGKTCSLLKAALELGGILAGVDTENQKTLVKCGSLLGRAYQVQDDWLGIWGKTTEIGKSNQSDLLERKKTFPILMGLENKGKFSALWNGGKFEDASIPFLTALLTDDGIKEKCEAEFHRLFALTTNSLGNLKGENANLASLTGFVQSLLNRKF
jgi:geranylgeranyl diphosphate synthase, type I